MLSNIVDLLSLCICIVCWNVLSMCFDCVIRCYLITPFNVGWWLGCSCDPVIWVLCYCFELCILFINFAAQIVFCFVIHSFTKHIGIASKTKKKCSKKWKSSAEFSHKIMMYSHTGMEMKVKKMQTKGLHCCCCIFGGGDSKSTFFLIFQRMMRCSFGYKAVEIRMDRWYFLLFWFLFCFRTIVNVLLGLSSYVFCCVVSFESFYLYLSTTKNEIKIQTQKNHIPHRNHLNWRWMIHAAYSYIVISIFFLSFFDGFCCCFVADI